MPFPDIDPVLISIGPLQIRWYALAYIAGIVAGWWYLARLLKQDVLWGAPGAVQTRPPISKDQLDDVLFYVTLGIILGGRLGFVFFYRPELLTEPLGDWPRILGFLPFPPALALWQGGMSFHGGLLGVAIATWWFSRKNAVNPLALGDLFACAAPIGLFFGRIANFINAELYGRPSDVPWAMVFPTDPTGLPRHPSQLYEAFLEGLVLFVVIRVAVTRFRTLSFPGATVGLFLSGYGLARFFVEFFREPDDYKYAGPLGFLTRGMLLSLPMVALGLFLLWRAYRGQQAKASA